MGVVGFNGSLLFENLTARLLPYLKEFQQHMIMKIKPDDLDKIEFILVEAICRTAELAESYLQNREEMRS